MSSIEIEVSSLDIVMVIAGLGRVTMDCGQAVTLTHDLLRAVARVEVRADEYARQDPEAGGPLYPPGVEVIPLGRAAGTTGADGSTP